MTNFSRRAFALSGLAGTFFLGACDNRRTNSSVDRIEGRVDSTLAQMYAGQRTLRLADGPDEVHHMVVGRNEMGNAGYKPQR